MILLLLLTSCDDVERHRTLTFFFDGVPPLRGEESVRQASDPNEKAGAAPPAIAWCVHEPVKDCTLCHGRQPRRGFSSKVQLVAEPPQLCYRCHNEYAALEGWIHGPVAAGDCLLCHAPHRTRTESLLTKPIPELCYQCHEVQAIHVIDKHDRPSYAHCTDCHEGHASVAKALLRTAVVAAREEPVAAVAAAEDRAAEQEKTAELYYRSIKQYHAGQFREAWQGFSDALKTGGLPDPMQETAHAYIANIEKILAEQQEARRRLPK
jgi:predicted CXXCH cytochrome family protein